jgi:hypothetical protein
MKKIIYYIFLIFFVLTQNNSYSVISEINFPDENFLQQNKNAFVSGRVIDERGFPVPYVKIIAGGKETQTDASGKFSILDLPLPYDLTAAERYSSTAVIYGNLSVSNPDIVLFGKPKKDYSNFVKAKVSFAKIPEGGSAVIKFISKDIFESGEEICKEGDSSVSIIVRWPFNQNSLRGQIAYIYKDKSGFKSSKFSEAVFYRDKKTTEFRIKSGSGNKIASSVISVYFPGNDYSEKGFSLSADFFNYYKNSGVVFFENEGSESQFRTEVPDNLPMTFKLKVRGYAYKKDGSGFENYFYTSPGSIVKIETETPPELLTPSDNFLAVDGNTRFSYSSGTGAGIYVLQLSSINRDLNFFIVTGEREAKLGYLSRKEFRNENVQFRWKVRKYITYMTVDEFVKPSIFNNDFGYKAVITSAEKSFKTGYY